MNYLSLSLLVAALSLCCVSTTRAQSGTGGTKSVSGTVVDENGEPVIGATIAVPGTQAGAVTDIDGHFTLTSPAAGRRLRVSYVGYETADADITGSPMRFTLKPEAHSLDEVVVVGYGTQKKKLVTGATTQMKGDDIMRLNTTSPLQAMQGQTPGVSITSTSGQPGENMKVIVRGLGTIGNSGPLYLIDGVGGDINTVNPADIESIDVLKDAASAAIYGAQAANGVVLVTTKHGKAGRARVTLDAYIGWQQVARKADMLNASEYMTIMDEQALNSGNGVYDWSKYNIRDINGNLNDTDWLNQVIDDGAMTQSYNIGVSGGSDVSTYAVSFGYMDQAGVVGGKDKSNYTRYNFRVNADQKLTKWAKIGEQFGVVHKKTRGINVGDQYNNSLRGAFAAAPIMPVYGNTMFHGSPTEAGAKADIYDAWYGFPYYDTSSAGSWWPEQGNPYGSMMVNNQNENLNTAFTGNVYAEIEPVKNLKFRTQLGVVYNTSESRSYKPLYHLGIYDKNTTMTEASQSMGHGLDMTFTNTLSYLFNVGDHEFTPMLGMESTRYEGTNMYGKNGYLKDSFNDWDHAYLNNATGTSTDEGMQVNGNPSDKARTVSYFARLGWNFRETYMVNATLRGDGSSRFASGHRYGWFPSVSAGWTITNEKFMESTKSWLDFFKLRVSWGQVGNQNIDNYQYLAPVQSTNTHYNFGTGLGATAQSENWGAYPSRLANPELTWETSEQTNIGFDARLLSGRLAVNFDYYWKTTKDWLVTAPMLATVGTGEPCINGGDVKNHGYELALNWNDHIGRDFRYNAGFNIAWNKNEVGNIPTEGGIIKGKSNMLYDNSEEFYRAQNGHAIGYFWGYKTAGIFQSQSDIDQWIVAGNGVKQGTPKPGDVKYYDVNHDGTINDADKVDLGNGTPDFTLGFTLGCQWHDFDFSLTAGGAFGQQIVQTYRNQANAKANYTKAILGRWTGEGTSDRIPRVTDSNINWEFSDLYIQDGDYLRISNITIGYDFAHLLRIPAIISQARLYFQVQNLCTFTSYDGMDPEIGYGTDKWANGIDVGYYPRPRTFLFGINVKF